MHLSKETGGRKKKKLFTIFFDVWTRKGNSFIVSVIVGIEIIQVSNDTCFFNFNSFAFVL